MKTAFLAALRSRLQRGIPALLSDAAVLLGALCCFGATLRPWFAVPHLAPIDAIANAPVQGLQPAVTWCFRALFLALALAVAARRWIPVVWQRRVVWWAAFGLLAALLYPTAILHTAPNFAARAAWQWNQHDQLTGYAGDIYTSQEVRDATWQQRIIVTNAPLTNRIVRLPTWSPATLEWGRFLEIAEWLGLAPWFSQSLSRGWVLAVAGSLLLVIALARARAAEEPQFLRVFGTRVAITFAAVVLLALAPFFLCGHLLTRARSLAQAGRYEDSHCYLTRAARVLPAIREDGNFLLQLGLLETELHRATPAAELYQARRLEEDGFAQQAQAALIAVLESSAPYSAIHREVIKGLMATAVESLNSGRIPPAVATLQRILAAEPCNLKANYALQIAAVRLGHIATIEELNERLRQSYRILNTPTKRSVLAAAQEHLAFAQMQSGTATGALAHFRAAKRPPK